MSPGGAPFRNPHNLPVKDCVVCGRPFTWRKKWEKCWDEITTCSNRCKTERKSRKSTDVVPVAAGVAAVALSKRQPKKNTSCEQTDSNESDSQDEECIEECLSPGRQFKLHTEENEELEADPRKQRKQALKAERRAKKEMTPQEKADSKRKQCDVCTKSVNLLVRCTIDFTQSWKMLCGRCWRDASGGVPDGDADHPFYRYGGLWKNRSALVATPKFGGKMNSDSPLESENKAEEDDGEKLLTDAFGKT